MFWVCVCSLGHVACTHAMSLWSVRHLQYSSTLRHKGHYFREEKIIVHKMCVLIFSTVLYEEGSSRARYDQKCILVIKWSSTRYSRQILAKLGFYRQIFQKYSNIKISWKSVQLEPSCSMRTDGQTDRQDKTKLMVAFRNFANTPKRLKSTRRRHRVSVVLNVAFFRIISPHFISESHNY